MLFIILPSTFALDDYTIHDNDNSYSLSISNSLDCDDFSNNQDSSVVCILGSVNEDNIAGNNDSSALSISDSADDVLCDDYYFDASLDNDSGSGNESNPYKYLTTDRFKDYSTIHLKNGEYELDDGMAVYSLSIIGENPQNTIIKFKNSDSIFMVNGGLSLRNVTLFGMPIVNYGTVSANNTIFKNSVAYSTTSEGTNLVNSASNSFGGAIYSPYYAYSTAYVSLDNCTFINNTGEYGGAIYMDGGYLDIVNTIFYDNYAYNYGGAIACEYNCQATIDKSRFVNSKSLNDAGGAIYLKESSLTANNIDFTNSQATFGGAITSLSSTLYLNFINAINSTAKYEGGALYQLYGYLTLRNGYFLNNSAKNGGALFIDDTSRTVLYQNKFINNTALQYAGAVYSLLNNNSRIRDNFNEFYGNHALFENDLYETSTIDLIIGSGNYTLYHYNDDFDGVIPSKYSSLDNGYVTSVKDQQSGGNCWAFAGLAVLESCILKASGDNVDLSEENMKNLMSTYSDYGWKMDTNQGGYPSMIMSYLTSWMGPVLEEDDLYDDYSTLSTILNSVVHVQNIKYIKRTSYTDNDGIKEAILRYGAVGCGIYFDSSYYNEETCSYYGSYTTSSNHAVAIVGWDDNYSKYNFKSPPRDDGAFLVKNSWNTDWGNEGYFYVSYYDTSFAAINQDEGIYTFILDDAVKYDKNYQYDVIGKTDYFISGNKNIWYQNIFEATDNEYLAAVSTYFEKTCNWDLSVYVNDTLKLVKSGISDCGYYTIDLGEYIKLSKSDLFKVMFKITVNGASFPVSEKIKSNKELYHEGTSFFSYDGKKWTDLYGYSTSYSTHTYDSQVACIKAFTFIDEIESYITLNISDNDYNPVDVVANVFNEYGQAVTGGNVTFKVDDATYIVPVSNGVARITLNLKEMATTNIEAIYDSVGYLSSKANGSVAINRLSSNIALEIVKNMISATINIDVSRPVNETFMVFVNGDNYTVNSSNGKAQLNLSNLECGNYSVKVILLNDTYVSNVPVKNFTIEAIGSRIIADNFIAYYNGGNSYLVKLVDINGRPVVSRDVIFTINGRSFKKVTDSNGTAFMSITLPIGEYVMDINFNGDNNYINSFATYNITVNSTIQPFESKNYLLNTKYRVLLLDKEGNLLKNADVTCIIDGIGHSLSTDDEGILSININLNPGNHAFSAVNPLNGEVLRDTIKVISRITSNKDLTMYFNNGASYKVRIFDDNGNPASGQYVTFKINGKESKIKSDSNGYASFKITLNPKTYTIIAVYKGFKVTNKVVVKPVLTAKNIVKKKSMLTKFSAKLVDGKGKALKGKIVTFKIKGKTYKVKTNNKGFATLSLKNLNVGKYTVTSTYGKSTIKNTIVVKK